MALLFIDSFDHYGTADILQKWNATTLFGTSATIGITATGRRPLSSAFRWQLGIDVHSLRGSILKSLAPADATCTIGCAINCPSASANVGGITLLMIRDGNSPQVSLRVNSTGTLSVMRGQGDGTVLGTTTATLNVGSYVYIELKVKVDSSVGTVDLRLDGASVLSLTGQNTRNTSANQWTSIALGAYESINYVSQGNNKPVDFDDLYVLDGTGAAPFNTFLGDCRVDARMPTGAGASTQWTPTPGLANWQCVDDPSVNYDADTVVAPTASLTDTFVVQDVVAGATVLAIQHCLNLKKADAGIATVVPIVRHSSTNYAGSGIYPTGGYTYGLQIQTTNPGTGAAWTEADFNACEFGYRRTV